jgi:uncharacterized tellurite resistance protein B-like protein
MGADSDISDDEVKLLIGMLHGLFTDEPERVILTDRKEIIKQLPAAIDIIKKEGGEQDKVFVLTRLAEIAYADGALMDPEARVILQVAEMLEYPSDRAYAIIVGAAQAGGLQKDAKLARIAAELRRTFMGAWIGKDGPIAF